MSMRLTLPAAAVLALAASAATAQVSPPTPVPAPNMVPGAPVVPTPLNMGFGNGFFGPFAQNFGFYPGYAAVPYNWNYYGPYPAYGGVYQLGPRVGVLNPLSQFQPPLERPVPVAGVNSPPAAARAGERTRVVTTPQTPEDFDRAARIEVRSSRAGTRESFREEAGRTDRDLGTRLETETAQRPTGATATHYAPATRDQVRLIAKAEHLMTQGPMRQGLVTKLSGSTVDVSYECAGRSRTDTFPAGEVFFFRPSGTLATAAMPAGDLRIGDRVMVACRAEGSRPRQAVAGSRQEIRTTASHKTTVKRSSGTRRSATRTSTTRR